MPTFTEEELAEIMNNNPDLAAKNGRAKEAAWLENNWWKGKPEIFARIAELEGKKP